MTAETLWMAWTAMGVTVPLSVCKALIAVERHCPSTGGTSWVTRAGSLYGNKPGNKSWPVLIEWRPCALTSGAVKALKAFVRDVLDDPLGWSDDVVDAVLTTEAVEWSGYKEPL